MLASCFAARGHAACSADGEPLIPPPVVPTLAAEAATPAELVPPGWTQVDVVHDDYDDDGRQDVALVIVHADPANVVENCGGLGVDRFDTSVHGLLVALQRADGGYVPFAQDYRLIPRLVDAVREPPYGGLATAKGVVSVRIGFWQSAGSWYTSTHEWKFRRDGNCMRLIGSEYASTHRASMDEERVSTNYLSGRYARSETDGDSGETKQTWHRIEGAGRHCLGDADAPWIEAQ